MTRSAKKGPYINTRLLRRVKSLNDTGDKKVLKTWDRACQIPPEFIGHTIGVHNGKEHVPVFCTELMVGHRLGEFAPTRRFRSHGGKLAK